MAATKPDEMNRRVTRHEPVPMSFDVGAETPLTVLVEELPWRKRIDFGELVFASFQNAVNQMLAIAQDEGGGARFESTQIESMIDYAGELALAFPNTPVETFDPLTFEQVVELLKESLRINGLDRMLHLVDPKALPLTTGESDSPAETQDGAKTD